MDQNDKSLIEQSLSELLDNDLIYKIFKKYNVPINQIFLIPIRFSCNIEVSARTQHGVIYLNDSLKDTPQKIPPYLIHEISHWLQQTTGDGPTQGSTDDTYLDNPYEIEGFQNQSKYLSETEGNQVAEKYIEKVLKHHNVPEAEKKDKKDNLLRLANKKNSPQLKLDLFKKQIKEPNSVSFEEIKEFMENYEENLAKIPHNPSRHILIEKIPDWDQKFRLRKLKELLNKLSD